VRTLLYILVPILLIAVIWFIVVEINESKNQTSNKNTATDSQVLQNQQNDKDDVYKTQIATSLCNILRIRGQIQIAEFNDCVLKNKNFPAEIYENVTKLKLGESWNGLADNEKALIVEEVTDWEVDTKSSYESAEQYEKMQQQINALTEKSNCELDMLKKSEPWIDERCPESNGILENVSCRTDVIGSEEYKKLFGC